MAKIEYPKGSNGERVQKWKVFGLFFYDTPFKNCIFSMDALIARRSKYDFWIPDEILTLEIKIQIKKYFFEIENFDRKIFSKKKSDQKNSHPKINFWSDFFPIDFFDFWMGKKIGPKKILNFFSIKIFDLEKIFF